MKNCVILYNCTLNQAMNANAQAEKQITPPHRTKELRSISFGQALPQIHPKILQSQQKHLVFVSRYQTSFVEYYPAFLVLAQPTWR
jgi:hypothetical protein